MFGYCHLQLSKTDSSQYTSCDESRFWMANKLRNGQEEEKYNKHTNIYIVPHSDLRLQMETKRW
jgi:hypothetical protein